LKVKGRKKGQGLNAQLKAQSNGEKNEEGASSKLKRCKRKQRKRKLENRVECKRKAQRAKEKHRNRELVCFSLSA